MTFSRVIAALWVAASLQVAPPAARAQTPASPEQWTVQKIAFETVASSSADSGGGNSAAEMAEKATAVAASDIYIADPVHSKPRWVAEGRYPAWSPDGSRLAYCVQRGLTDFGQIRVVNADGKGDRKFTHLQKGACKPVWSPDGTQMAVTQMAGIVPHVIVVDQNGDAVRDLGEGRDPRWSPAGHRILFLRKLSALQRGTEIWIANVDGSGAKKIIEDTSSDVQADWLPHAVGILFASGRDGLSAVFTADPEGGSVRKLGSQPAENWFHPQISPDGRTLVIESVPLADAFLKRASIEQIGLRSHKASVLAEGFHESLFWGPAGH